MDRRKVLLLFAVIVAALGTALVFLYARGADARAEERFETQQVLLAVATIDPGETIESAQQAGKLSMQAVANDAILGTALTSTAPIAGQAAITPIYAGEQIIPEKFGSSTEGAAADLPIPEDQIAISVNLTDPARVSGFVNPNSEVAIFVTVPESGTGPAYARMVLDKITVLGVGSSTPVTTTTTTEEGTTTEQLPATLLTLAVTKEQAEKILFAQSIGELAFGLTTETSQLPAGQGANATNLFR